MHVAISILLWPLVSFCTLYLICQILIFVTYTYTLFLQAVPKKMAQSLWHLIFATARHRVMQFSTKCPEINWLHDKSQCLNAAVKYSLFCSWQVNYSKSKLTSTYVLTNS